LRGQSGTANASGRRNGFGRSARTRIARSSIFSFAVFYRYRCLVCEEAMRRKREDQRFKIGHNTCKKEYQHFPHVFDYIGVNPGYPTGVAMSASQTLDSSGSKVAVGDDLPRKMFWRDKAGRGWYWEADELGEHRLFNRSGAHQ
jgi:hypothetical protein